MYIPKIFRVSDPESIKSFIQLHPFGTLVATQGNTPIASHIPMHLRGDYLTCHVAFANPIWKALAANPSALAIFTGPHAYVSSSWYGHVNVPTWNYEAVHVTGKATIMHFEELREDLESLLEAYESGREGGVVWSSLPEDYVSIELKKIVGIRIAVEKVEASQKMSQNREDGDYDSICRHLEDSEREEERQTAAVMRQLRSCPFSRK